MKICGGTEGIICGLFGTGWIIFGLFGTGWIIFALFGTGWTIYGQGGLFDLAVERGVWYEKHPNLCRVQMNSLLQNLSEEVITDWPETKDPLVTTFKSTVKHCQYCHKDTIASSTLYPMFSRELRIVTGFVANSILLFFSSLMSGLKIHLKKMHSFWNWKWIFDIFLWKERNSTSRCISRPVHGTH